MPTRIFYVPVLLCIEADNKQIAVDEGLTLARAVAEETGDRHLRKDVLVPGYADPLPDSLALPFERFLHRGITH
jgi:hypothetical protein